MSLCKIKYREVSAGRLLKATVAVLWEWLMTRLWCAAVWKHCSLEASSSSHCGIIVKNNVFASSPIQQNNKNNKNKNQQLHRSRISPVIPEGCLKSLMPFSDQPHTSVNVILSSSFSSGKLICDASSVCMHLQSFPASFTSVLSSLIGSQCLCPILCQGCSPFFVLTAQRLFTFIAFLMGSPFTFSCDNLLCL